MNRLLLILFAFSFLSGDKVLACVWSESWDGSQTITLENSSPPRIVLEEPKYPDNILTAVIASKVADGTASLSYAHKLFPSQQSINLYRNPFSSSGTDLGSALLTPTMELAEFMWHNRNYAGALDLYDRQLSVLLPVSTDSTDWINTLTLNYLARRYMVAGRYQTAELLIRTALSEDIRWSRLHPNQRLSEPVGMRGVKLGVLLEVQLRQDKQSEAALTEELLWNLDTQELKAGNSGSYESLLRAYFAINDLESASRVYNKALKQRRLYSNRENHVKWVYDLYQNNRSWISSRLF
jgi:hypothetical protein